MLQVIVIRHGERAVNRCRAGETPLVNECSLSVDAQPFGDKDLTPHGYCRANALVGFLGQFKSNLSRIYATASDISIGNCACAGCKERNCNGSRREELTMIPFSKDSCTPITLIGCKEDYYGKVAIVAQDIFKNKLQGNIVVCLDHGGIGTFIPALIDTLASGKPVSTTTNILKYPSGITYDTVYILSFKWNENEKTLVLQKMTMGGQCLLVPGSSTSLDPNDRTSSYCLVKSKKGNYSAVAGSCPAGSAIDPYFKTPICDSSVVQKTPCTTKLQKCVAAIPNFKLVNTCKGCPSGCSSNGKCTNGQCVCNTGYLGGDCSTKCAGTTACPGTPVCSGHGTCTNGTCTCGAGYTGADCSTSTCPGTPVCSGNGTCGINGCVCNSGFTGSDCSVGNCPGDPVCSGHGTCVKETNTCLCDDGYSKKDCSIAPNIPCGSCINGTCVAGKCVCNDGFAGEDCSFKLCPNSCSGNGLCVNGNCSCYAGYLGNDCMSQMPASCPNSCSGNGKCVEGSCVCDEGWSDSDCNTVSSSSLNYILFIFSIAFLIGIIYFLLIRS